jgi:hypothetical protein
MILRQSIGWKERRKEGRKKRKEEWKEGRGAERSKDREETGRGKERITRSLASKC